MGEIETRNVGGGLGGIGGRTLPEDKLQYKTFLPKKIKSFSILLSRIDERWRCLLESWNLVHQAVEP